MVRKQLAAVAAVERELKELAKLAPALAESSLAATALALARELDAPGNSATSKAMCAKAMVDVVGRLRELAPEKPERSKLDDLSARRQARIAGGAKT